MRNVSSTKLEIKAQRKFNLGILSIKLFYFESSIQN